MKKWIIAILLILLTNTNVGAEYFRDIIVNTSSGIWTDSRAYTSLSAAISAIGSDERDLYVAQEEVVTSLTIPENIRLHFLRSGAIANSGQLTINTKSISAANQQIFTGAGDIDFAVGSTVKSSWFSSASEAINITNDDQLTLVISDSSFINEDCAVGNDVTLKWESPRNRLTISAGYTMSNIKNIEAGDYQLFAGAGDFDFVDGTKLMSSWFMRLRSATNWIENEEVTLVIQGTINVSYTQTSGAETTIDLTSANGYLNINPGVTLTINGRFICDENKTANSGTGTLILGPDTTSHMNIRWFGATPGWDVTNTADIQSAFDCAYTANVPVYIPSAEFTTGTITYYGQSIYGVPGSGNRFRRDGSGLVGRPGEDILAFEDISNQTQNVLDAAILKDFHMVVDDSIDASASFPNRARDGVGNAAISVEWTDGSDVDYQAQVLSYGTIRNVSIESLSGSHQNNSCGVFMQGSNYGTVWDNVNFARLEFGWWGDYSVANVGSYDGSNGDSSTWIEPYFGSCGHAFQHYNGSTNKWVGGQVYCASDNQISLRIVSNAGTRTCPYQWSFRDLFNEGGETGNTEFMRIEGSDHRWLGGILDWGNGDGYVTWAANNSWIVGASIWPDDLSTTKILRISGDENNFEKLLTGAFPDSFTAYNLVSDTGTGNKVSFNNTGGTSRDRTRDISWTPMREGIFRERNADFAHTTPSAPYSSNNDMFYWASDMTFSPAGTLTKDTTLISGEYKVIPSPGSGNASWFNAQRSLVGYEVPQEKCMFYVHMKNASSNTTQTWTVYSDVTVVGTKSLSTTTSWATYSFPIDFTAAGVAKGESIAVYFNAPTANQAIDIAWMAIVPVKPYYVGLERSADPPEPDEGQFVIWMSDGTGKGDDGDIMVGSKAGGTANYGTLFDHSGGAAW